MRRRLDAIALALAIAILLAVSAFAYRTTDDLIETTGWVDHTHEVLSALSDIAVGTMSAGPARRAYNVSGNPADLASMEASIARSQDAVSRVRSLTVDSPSQQKRLGRLQPLLEERARELRAEAIPGLPPVNDAEALRRSRVSAQMGAIIDEMKSDERQLLSVREAAAHRDAMRAKIAEVGGTAASIIILAIAFARLRRENGRRLQSEQLARKSEKETAQTNRFLDSIVENIPNMLFVKGASELRFERVNRAGELLLGVPRTDLIGKNDFDFFPADEATFFQEKDRETLSGNAVVDIQEEPLETTSGRRWLHTKKVPIANDEGQPTHLLGISEDITELREARRAAQDAARELEAFSYSVAHDLRAPLRSIDGFSQVVLEDEGPALTDKGRANLGRVRAATKRMGQIIDDLLMLARVSRSELQRDKTDLSRLAAECAAELKRAQPARDVAFDVPASLVANADASLLRIVMENLLGNAFKFTSKREVASVTVGITKTEAGERAYFVRDNGAGFDMQYADKLFRPFQRLHDARDFQGTGIGLATVRRVIERHGGRIWAESAVDAGATFFFTLGDEPKTKD